VSTPTPTPAPTPTPLHTNYLSSPDTDLAVSVGTYSDCTGRTTLSY
jgi:hypothetical protein